MSNPTSTATTRETQVVAPAHVIYNSAPPRGHVTHIATRAPSRRS